MFYRQHVGVCIFVVLLSFAFASDEKQSLLHDSKVTHDKDHIKEHLKDEIGDIKEDEMSDEDLQFHYFRLHDYDGNKKLDGLELMQAMSDYHNESGIQDERETSEEAMASTIDQILSYDDANDDGYIDYPEYIKSQQKLEEKDKGESNKPQ